MNVNQGFKRLAILVGIIAAIGFFLIYFANAYDQIGTLVLVSLLVGLASSGITLLVGYVIKGFFPK